MVNLASPWVTYYRKLEALFGCDPDIRVEYLAGDGQDPVVKLYVEDECKADAIAKLLPSEKDFGNTTMAVTVVPANTRNETRASLIERAFAGNPAYSYGITVDGAFSNPITYIVFRNKVVQFYNDDLGDVNGMESTLYEFIADEILGGDEGVYYCTDLPDNLGKLR